MRTLAVDRVTAEVISAFDAADIPSILLKGPSIARWLYPAGGRTYGDTDVLVPASEFCRAEAVLERLGFMHLLEGWAESERPKDVPQRAFIRRHRERPGAVDLHRSLPQLRVSDELAWEVLSAEADALVVCGVTVTVLNTTALALHIVLHAVQHGHGSHTGEDLRRVVERVPLEQWRPVGRLAMALGVEDCLGLGLRLDPAGARIADSLGLRALEPESSPSWLFFAPRGSVSLGRLGTATLRDKLLTVRGALLPSPAKVRYVTGLPRGRRWALAVAYGRWWSGVVRSLIPALRYVVSHRRVIARFPPP